MTNLIKAQASPAIPAPTPQLAKSLSQQELAEHRRSIAFEVKVILSAYFQPHEDADVKAAQLAWWCDELQDWTREQVVYALRKWNREKPRLRPTAGDIVSMLKKLRGEKEAKKMIADRAAPQEHPKERISKERADEILSQAGFAVKKFGGNDK